MLFDVDLMAAMGSARRPALSFCMVGEACAVIHLAWRDATSSTVNFAEPLLSFCFLRRFLSGDSASTPAFRHEELGPVIPIDLPANPPQETYHGKHKSPGDPAVGTCLGGNESTPPKHTLTDGRRS